jgi:hypothetical protein
MSSTGVCNDYITIPLSIVCGLLAVCSEILGMRSDKENKCTSIVQFLSAGVVWLYLKIRRGFYRCCPRVVKDDEPEDKETLTAVSATVSRHVTIDNLPTWRRRRVTPPPVSAPLTILSEEFQRRLSAEHHIDLSGDGSIVVVVSRPPSRAG